MTTALTRHVVLIGLRASGKSTVGAALAAALGTGFIDLDDRTRDALGAATVREAFERCGEPSFRAAEARVLTEVLGGTACVVALGGGTPTAPGAGALLERARSEGRALIVFLDPPDETLAARLTAHQGDRPSLTGRGVVEEVAEIAERRRPLYAALADLRLREPFAVDSVVSIITSQVGSDSSSST
jgi:shikimate kinase